METINVNQKKNDSVSRPYKTGLWKCSVRLMAMFFAMLAFMACPGTDDPDPDPDPNPDPNKPVAVTSVKIDPPSATTLANLTAGGGSITLSVTIEPANATDKSVTWKSSNTAVATVNNDGVVTGVKEGKSTISANTKSGNKTAEFEVEVKPAPATGPVELTSAMINQTNANLAAGVYVVKNNLTLNGGNTLTIAAGTTIRFDKDRRLETKADAKIIAKGTSSQKITFTSSAQSPAAGDWHGLWLYGTNNEFDYCVFEYGSGYQSAVIYGFLTLYETGTASITNCTFRHAKYSGVTLRGTASRFTKFDNNTITDCGEDAQLADAYPIYSNDGFVNLIDMGANNTITTTKGIGINGGTVGKNITLRNYTYIIAYGNPTFNNSAVVTIEAGATLKFQARRRIDVKGGAKIIAVGTSSKPIKFTSALVNPNPGDWAGIYLESNGSDFKYCTFEYGSSEQSAVLYAMLFLENCTASVTNCTFRDGKYSGVSVRSGNSGFTAFDNNTITNCGKNQAEAFPLAAWGGGAGLKNLAGLGSNNTFDGTIGVGGGAINFNMTVRNYVYTICDWFYIENSAVVTIEAGATFKFETNKAIYVKDGAKIVATGTSSKPITFTSAKQNPGPGDWRGINLESNGSDFKYCTFEYGSSEQSSVLYAMLFLENCKASVTNCTFRNGKYSGVSLRSGNSGFTAFDNNKITNCGKDQADAFPLACWGGGAGFKNLSGLGDNNTFDGTIGVGGGTVNADVTVKKYTYTVCDWFEISNSTSSATLTVLPGAKLMFRQNMYIYIGAGGRLVAKGTSSDKVIFTGSVLERGWWRGLEFTNSKASTVSGGSLLEYCEVSYGGRGTSNSSNANITCASIPSGVLTVRNCWITHSRAWGILVQTGSMAAYPNIVDSTITYSNNGPNNNSNKGIGQVIGTY